MSAPKDDLLRAVELAMAGKWDVTHETVQQYEDDASEAVLTKSLCEIEFLSLHHSVEDLRR